MKKVMRFYEVDKGDYEKLQSRYERPDKPICSAILQMQITPVSIAPKETVKFRLYLTREEFKTLDRKAKEAGVSSAAIIRGIAAALAGK